VGVKIYGATSKLLLGVFSFALMNCLSIASSDAPRILPLKSCNLLVPASQSEERMLCYDINKICFVTPKTTRCANDVKLSHAEIHLRQRK